MMRKFAIGFTLLALSVHGAAWSTTASNDALDSDFTDEARPAEASPPARPAAPAESVTKVRVVAPPAAPAPTPSANPLWGIPLSRLSGTRDRPIFSPSRRPPPVAVGRGTGGRQAAASAKEGDRAASACLGRDYRRRRRRFWNLHRSGDEGRATAQSRRGFPRLEATCDPGPGSDHGEGSAHGGAEVARARRQPVEWRSPVAAGKRRDATLIRRSTLIRFRRVRPRRRTVAGPWSAAGRWPRKVRTVTMSDASCFARPIAAPRRRRVLSAWRSTTTTAARRYRPTLLRRQGI